MKESPGYMTWFRVSAPIELTVCVVLIAAGVGLLLLKPWARKVSIGYAVYAIIFDILTGVVNYTFLIGPMLAEAAQQNGRHAGGAIGGAIGGTIGGIVSLIYPILLLIFMTRPKMAAAFRPPGKPPALPRV